MLETCSTVVTFADISKVVDEWLQRWVILIIDVHDLAVTEVTLLFARVTAALVRL